MADRALPARPAAATATLRQRVPALLLRWLFTAIGYLDVQRCSDLGGGVLRRIGPRLPVNRVAQANLELAMPELDRAARRRICAGMWENLGRNVAEIPHLAKLRRTDAGPGWEIEGESHFREAIARHGQLVFFSAHLGNWEMILPIAAALGFPVAGIYRAASNPCVDEVIQRERARAHQDPPMLMFPKGAAGARAALRHLAAGGSIGFLADQKMNDGIAVPFFGKPAMTASAPAQLALRFGCPLLPVRVRRLGAARVRLICEPPLPLSAQADVLALTTAINATIERWIRDEPQAWLWMHRRWMKPGTEPALTRP
jgi:KDO2-lipid IV(A) lauroyltransferase